MPLGYQTDIQNRQNLNVLSNPGLQKGPSTGNPNFGASPIPGTTPTGSMQPGSFAQPGTSSYSFPSSSINPAMQQQPLSENQNPSLGGNTGMPPSMSTYADSSNISTLLRALTGNKDRI